MRVCRWFRGRKRMAVLPAPQLLCGSTSGFLCYEESLPLSTAAYRSVLQASMGSECRISESSQLAHPNDGTGHPKRCHPFAKTTTSSRNVPEVVDADKLRESVFRRVHSGQLPKKPGHNRIVSLCVSLLFCCCLLRRSHKYTHHTGLLSTMAAKSCTTSTPKNANERKR